jgi:hypothetical protein
VSVEINLSFVDVAAIGVRLTLPFSRFTFRLCLIVANFEFATKLELSCVPLVLQLSTGQFRP